MFFLDELTVSTIENLSVPIILSLTEFSNCSKNNWEPLSDFLRPIDRSTACNLKHWDPKFPRRTPHSSIFYTHNLNSAKGSQNPCFSCICFWKYFSIICFFPGDLWNSHGLTSFLCIFQGQDELKKGNLVCIWDIFINKILSPKPISDDFGRHLY